MDEATRDLVWGRAGGACEYCRIPQAFYRARYQIDHVIARQHGGSSVPDNLALICPHCNLHKGPNLAGIDPVTAQMVRLFHPVATPGPTTSPGPDTNYSGRRRSAGPRSPCWRSTTRRTAPSAPP